MLVDWKQPCDRVGFDDLVLAEDQLQGKHATIIDPAILKDRLLVLARTNAKSQTLLLPTGRMGSPGELFAEAIATAETNAFARPAGLAGSLVVLLLGLGIAWLVEPRQDSRRSRSCSGAPPGTSCSASSYSRPAASPSLSRRCSASSSSSPSSASCPPKCAIQPQ